MRYFVMIDGEADNYGVVFPDLPGCAAMGKTIDGALANAAEALRDWVEVTEENGETVPAPRALEELRRGGSRRRRQSRCRAACARHG